MQGSSVFHDGGVPASSGPFGQAQPGAPFSSPQPLPGSSNGGLYPEPPRSGHGLGLVCVAIIAVAAFGIVWKMKSDGKSQAQPASQQAAAPAQSFFSQQQEMMHEAMQMAREAREMQKEHMNRMRQAMEEAEGGEVLPTGGR